MVSFPGNQDYVNLLAGLPSGTLFGPDATYGEITVGVTYDTPINKDMSLMIRPELRYDRALKNAPPVNNFQSKDMFTPAFDIIALF